MDVKISIYSNFTDFIESHKMQDTTFLHKTFGATTLILMTLSVTTLVLIGSIATIGTKNITLLVSNTKCYSDRMSLGPILRHQQWRKTLRNFMTIWGKNKFFFFKINPKLWLIFVLNNGTARLKNCKQLFEYQHLLLLRDIWCSNL
jgi:hypothetical protein